MIFCVMSLCFSTAVIHVPQWCHNKPHKNLGTGPTLHEKMTLVDIYSLDMDWNRNKPHQSWDYFLI